MLKDNSKGIKKKSQTFGSNNKLSMLSAIYQQYNTGKVKPNLEQVFTTALPGPSFPWQLGLAITA